MKYTFLSLLFFASMTTSIFSQIAPSLEDIKGAQVGDTVLNFTLLDQNGKSFTLSEALKDGPVVMLFYRGQWCPFCNKHMLRLQDSLPLIEAKGARLIAISPENPEYLEKMEAKTGAHFTLLYDSSYQVARAMDVLWSPDEKLITKYDNISGKPLNEVHGTENTLLPVPATFIINQQGVIVWRHFEPNYKERSGVDAILRAIP